MTYNVFGGTLSLTQSINQSVCAKTEKQPIRNWWNLLRCNVMELECAMVNPWSDNTFWWHLISTFGPESWNWWQHAYLFSPQTQLFLFNVVVICPIAIAYSMGQIVILCVYVHLNALSRSHFLIDFRQNRHWCKNPQNFVGSTLHHPSPILPTKPPF